jgi:hypothetical protein
METKDLALIAYLDLNGIQEAGHRFEGNTAYFTYDNPLAPFVADAFFADEGRFKTYHQKFRSKKSQIDTLKGVANGYKSEAR